MKQQLMLRVSTVGATTAVAGTAAGMSLASKAVLVALAVTGAVGAGSLSVWALRSPGPPPVTRADRSTPAAGEVAAAGPGGELTPAATPMVPAAPPATRPARVTAAPTTAPARRLPTTPPVAAARATVRAPRPTTPPAAATPPLAEAASNLASADPGPGDRATKLDDRALAAAPAAPTATRVEAADPEPELRALRDARDDLRAGRPASAYRRLEDFNRQRPGGMLAQERSALAAIALCRWQPGREAQARAAEFLRRMPESPLADRVKSACGLARGAGQKDSW